MNQYVRLLKSLLAVQERQFEAVERQLEGTELRSGQFRLNLTTGLLNMSRPHPVHNPFRTARSLTYLLRHRLS